MSGKKTWFQAPLSFREDLSPGRRVWRSYAPDGKVIVITRENGSRFTVSINGRNAASYSTLKRAMYEVKKSVYEAYYAKRERYKSSSQIISTVGSAPVNSQTLGGMKG